MHQKHFVWTHCSSTPQLDLEWGLPGQGGNTERRGMRENDREGKEGEKDKVPYSTLISYHFQPCQGQEEVLGEVGVQREFHNTR